MARYGKIESGFWHSPKVRRLSQDAKFMMLYLLSCPHGNAIGCFVLHDGYIAADLGWASDVVGRCVQELIEKGLIERDNETLLLRILGWWGHNTIENANVAKHVAKEIAALPGCDVKEHLIDAVRSITGLHESVAQILSERLGKPFQNGSERVSQPLAKPYRNQEPSLALPNIPEPMMPAAAGARTVEDGKSKKRGSRIAADWRPSEADRQFARSLGFTEREIDGVYPGFLDYWTAKAGPNGVKADWSATWRNWIRKEAERTDRKAVRSPEASADRIDWDRAVADYRESNGSRWPFRQLGPEPGYSGCRAPMAVLAKYGLAISEVAPASSSHKPEAN